MQSESWNTCIRNRAHQTRTKRLHCIPVDLSMPRAHTSEPDGLRLCQCTANDLRGFHLQNPAFLCMLMCLRTHRRQGCTWQSMCAVMWIRCMNICVYVDNGQHCSLSFKFNLLRDSPLRCVISFSRWSPLFLSWKTAGTTLVSVYSTSSHCPSSILHIFFQRLTLFLLLHLSLNHT